MRMGLLSALMIVDTLSPLSLYLFYFSMKSCFLYMYKEKTEEKKSLFFFNKKEI